MAVWGGDGVAELAKEISAQVKKLKKPEIKGGAVDGVVIGPDAGRGHHQAPQPRGPDRPRGRAWPWPRSQRVVALANAPAGGLLGQLKTLSEGAAATSPAEAEARPRREARRRRGG